MDDPQVWNTLDDLLMNGHNNVRAFLDALNQHRETLSGPMKSLLFGGMGHLVVAYNEARTELNEPRVAFGIALESMVANPQFAALMLHTINIGIDNKVDVVR